MLAHTSGLPHYLNSKEIENKVHYANLDEVINVFKNTPLLFEPGTQHHYSVYGYVLLGKVIELVSGSDFADYVQENILNVVGMHDTSVELFGSKYENKSSLYIKQKKKAKRANQNDLSNRVPAGGYQSTLSDMLKFGQAILDQKLISEKSIKEMTTFQPVAYDGNKYGLGFRLYGSDGAEHKLFGHDGSQTGCSSLLFIVPDHKTVIVTLSNTARMYKQVAMSTIELLKMTQAHIAQK